MAANWFIGVRVPAGDWFATLPEIPSGFQQFTPTDLHVTVAFLGPIAPAAAEAAWNARQPHGPIAARLGAVKPFGRQRAYSALSAEVESEALHQLLADQCNLLRKAAGLPPEHRDARPHATLTRPARSATEAQRAAGLVWAQCLRVAGTPVTLDRIALFTGANRPQTGLFRIVHEAPL